MEIDYNKNCPITINDVANTRGKAFLDLSVAQQQSCGGFNGKIYQEGLKIVYKKSGGDKVALDLSIPLEIQRGGTITSVGDGYTINNNNILYIVGGITLILLLFGGKK
jgi:hypothetical protein